MVFLINSQPLVPICIMACRLIREKGIAEFVEAAKLLRKCDIQARFWLVGEPDLGNPTCISKKQLEAWKEEKIVEFLGHRLDMPQLLQQSHVAILSSFYGEGVPRFLLEAVATGLPLVATEIEGCQLVVKEGINGFLVPPKNSQALANAIKKLLIDEDLRKQFGKASRHIAINKFDEQKIFSQYEALYRSMGILL